MRRALVLLLLAGCASDGSPLFKKLPPPDAAPDAIVIPDANPPDAHLFDAHPPDASPDAM
jgi:hypothetical protein